METYTCIALSTAHIKETDRDLLHKLEASTCRVMSREYGYFIKLTGELDIDLMIGDSEGVPLSDSLKEVILFAYQVKNCLMIELDCDADTVSVLPTYDW